MSFGDLVAINEDGALDAWLGYGWDGRSVIVRRGMVGAAYPSGFETVFEGTAEQIEASQSSLVLKIRDNMLALAVPLQPRKYGGTNSLPDGLDGTPDDLAGKPIPRVFGSVLNVSVPCANTSKLIYQVNDGPVASVGAAYDEGIALGSSTWLANGNGGGLIQRSATSPDGQTWEQITPLNSISSNYLRFACGGGTIVAIAQGGVCYSSPDGTLWTLRTLTNWGAADVQAVTYGNSIFVAVGNGGKIATSSDGVTWAMVADALGVLPNPFGGSGIFGAAYGNSLWVFVGDAGKLYSTTDFITFTVHTSQFGASYIADVNWNGALFVAVGQSGKTSTSTDGASWTARTASAALAGRVAYGAGQWVQATYDGLWGSADGLTWAKRTTALSATVVTVTFAAEIFLSGHNDGVIGVSADGSAWTPLASTFAVIGQVQEIYYATGLVTQTYADAADLLDDTKAPLAGLWKAYLPGGYIRLGSPPAGLITADVTEGAAASDRTAGQMFARLLSDPLGAPLQEFSSADIAALDTANASVLGFWSGTDEWSVADVLDWIAQSVGAWWGADRAGVMRIKQFTAPSGTPVVNFTANDLLKPLERVPVNDETKGLPVWRSTIRYAKNWSVQVAGVAGGVTDARRAFLAAEWREAKAEDTTVQLAHPLAPQTVEDSLIYLAANALTEATRRQALRGVQRDRYNIVVPSDSDHATTETLDLGDVVSLTHSRYALAGGPSFRIIGLEPDASKRQLSLTLWR
jgi:hypothetical protein